MRKIFKHFITKQRQKKKKIVMKEMSDKKGYNRKQIKQ